MWLAPGVILCFKNTTQQTAGMGNGHLYDVSFWQAIWGKIKCKQHAVPKSLYPDFDPAFEAFCRARVKEKITDEMIHDPTLLGYFVDK